MRKETKEKKIIKIIILLCAVLTMFFPPALCFAAEDTEDLAALDQITDELSSDFAAYEQYFSLSSVWEQIKAGELSLDLQGIWQLLIRLFLDEIAGCGKLLAELAVLAIIAVLLENLSSAFGNGTVSKLAHGVVYLLLLGVAVVGFKNVSSLAAEAIEKSSDFLFAVLPMMMTFLAAIGGVGTVALMNPSLLFALSVVTALLSQIIFPVIYFAGVLKLLTCFSPKFNVDKLAKLCKSVSLGLLTACTGLFIAFLSIGGVVSASAGGLAVKAAKAAGSLFIPVVGKSLADALDSVISVSLVLKNGIGLFGVIVILLYTAFPAIKILVISLLYKLTGALLEPMGGSRLSEALYEIGGVLQSLFAAVAIGGLFFFFVLAITVGMGNVTMMMR